MTIEAEIERSLTDVLSRIEDSAKRAGRSAPPVQLVAVSKKQPLERVLAFQRVCAQRKYPVVLGENYVQEFQAKQPSLLPHYRCHLIGPLQSNKAARAVELFDVIESVHSLSIAKALDAAAGKRKKVQEIFLQVNVSNDPAKSGLSVDECLRSFASIEAFAHVKVTGLMTITWDYDQAEDARPDFKALSQLRSTLGRPHLKLSMGMSKDFEVAIEEGSDIVRVGTALFGERGS